MFTMRGCPSGMLWSIVTAAPERLWIALIVSPPFPMTKPTRFCGHSSWSVADTPLVRFGGPPGGIPAGMTRWTLSAAVSAKRTTSAWLLPGGTFPAGRQGPWAGGGRGSVEFVLAAAQGAATATSTASWVRRGERRSAEVAPFITLIAF